MVQIFSDISQTGPKIKFNTGNVVNGQEEYNPTLPAVDGQLDNDWTLTVWRAQYPNYLNPTAPILNDTKLSDPVLGTPKYTWGDDVSANGQEKSSYVTRFSVYGSSGNYTYELSAANGDYHDVYLQTYSAETQGKIYTLDHPLTFTANERVLVSNASGGFGAGYQTGNNFSFDFNIPQSPYYNASLPGFSMVVQVPIYWTKYPNGNGRAEYGLASTDVGYYTPFSIYYDYSQYKLVDDTSAPTLRLSDRSDQLHQVSINVNAAFYRAVQALAANNQKYASAYLDPHNWTVVQYYAGTEASGNGSGAIALDVNNPNYQIDNSSTYNYSVSVPIQTIDNGHYINTVLDSDFNTLANSTNTISLIGANQTFSSLGNDTVSTSQQASGTSSIFNNSGNLTVSGNGNTNIYAGHNSSDQLSVTAGNGTQTLFAAQNILTAYGNHDVDGTQVIIAGTNNNTSIVYGGKTHQSIYTGTSNFTIVSGNNSTDNTGNQAINVQGGASSYWGGVENATFTLSGGSLYASLGSGSAAITADMTKGFSATFVNYSTSNDHLILNGNVSSVTHNNGNTDIYSSNGSHITLQHVTAFVHDYGNNVAAVF